MSLDSVQRALEDVPRYEGFLTYSELERSSEELVREYRDFVRLIDIGSTRCGKRIRALVLGNGSRKAFLFGAPHPNEPVGTLVLDYLSWRFAQDESLRKALDYTLIIVKVADIDGLILNEGWFKGPLTIAKYVENYYRSAGDVQIEWSFPIRYKRLLFEKPVPETVAIMKLIDSYKPSFIYSLHNAGFGGVYYYISEEAPLLYPIYQLYPKSLGIPLSLGEPEVPWASMLSKAVYKMVSTKDFYEFLEAQGVDPIAVIRHGGNSYDYASNLNPRVFELVAEVPYFYDPRVEDLDEDRITRREAILKGLSIREDTYRVLEKTWKALKGVLRIEDPCSEEAKLAESIEYFIQTAPKLIESEKAWALKNPGLNRRATRAEVFDNTFVEEFYSALIMGMLKRIVLKKDLKRIAFVRPVIEDFETAFEERIAKLESNKSYRVIEIEKLVKVQLAAGLYTMLYLQSCHCSTS